MRSLAVLLTLVLAAPAPSFAAEIGLPAANPGAAPAPLSDLLAAYFASPNPDLAALRPALTGADLTPLAAQLQAAARAALDPAAPARAEKLAVLAAPGMLAQLPPALRLDVYDAYREARDAAQKRDQRSLDSRMRLVAAALTFREAADNIVIVSPIQEPGERPRAGRDQSQALEDLVKDHADGIRLLSSDGPAAIFQQTFAAELAPEERDHLLEHIREVPGTEAHTLKDVTAAGLRRAPAPLGGAEELASFKERLERGSLRDRLSAFAELASRVEGATPEQLAAIPEAARDELLNPIYHLAATIVDSFNMIRGDARNDLRAVEWEKRAGGETPDYVGLEKAVQAGLADPALRARFEPLRELVVRQAAVMAKLDTPLSREHVLRMIPHAEYAGLSAISETPKRREDFAVAWLQIVEASIDETIHGLRINGSREDHWTGSQRSGGFEHLDARRQSMHLYQWKPGRFDPGDMRHEAALLLGLPGGEDVAALVVQTLLHAQGKIPEIAALDRRRRLAEDYRSVDARIEHAIERYRQAGQELDPASVEEWRRQLREEAESNYAEHGAINGQSVVDGLLYALRYDPYLSFAPGFDENRYVGNVLAAFEGALDGLTELGTLSRTVDSAVSFLLSLVRSPLLEDAALRGRAVSLWHKISEKAAGLPLRTRLDGVIDPRPQVGPQSSRLSGDVDGRSGYRVWQLAESPDGRYLARAGADRVILVWDAATGELVKTIKLDDARQYYGDLANSLGAAFTPDGKLMIATLHDVEGVNAGKGLFQKVRVFDLSSPKAELGPGDALSEGVLPEVAVLRHLRHGPNGTFAAAEVKLYEKDGQHSSRYAGSDVRLFRPDGRELSRLAGRTLLDTSADRVLAGTPANDQADLSLFDVSDPSAPRDVTPPWLALYTKLWAQANPPNKYGWRPKLEARLAAFGGKAALLVFDGGALKLFDLETGDLQRALPVPNGWRASAYVVDAGGSRLASVVSAPGSLEGAQAQRVMAWDLATGEVLLERDSKDVGELLFAKDGRIVSAGSGRVELFPRP